MKKTETYRWYWDNGLVQDAVVEIATEHPGSTQLEMVQFAKERGIPRYYTLCCLRHSVMLRGVKDATGRIHYYARDRDEVEEENRKVDENWWQDVMREHPDAEIVRVPGTGREGDE